MFKKRFRNYTGKRASDLLDITVLTTVITLSSETAMGAHRGWERDMLSLADRQSPLVTAAITWEPSFMS